jgi:hypothetical protein
MKHIAGSLRSRIQVVVTMLLDLPHVPAPVPRFGSGL